MTNNKIKSFEEVCKLVKKYQKDGKKVVFCHGFFDILHRGHITLLTESKKKADILIVGLDSDENARFMKGPNRPINDQDSRLFVLSNLQVVDYVFPLPSIKLDSDLAEQYIMLYKKLEPDLLTTSIRAGKHGALKRYQAEAAKIDFVDIDHGIYDKRTSKTIELLGLE